MADKLPTVVIVGRPNVGKSTLFNRIVKKRLAVVEDEPGITRDRLYAAAEWNGKRYQVVDTGGIVFNESDPLAEQIRVQANVALAEADIVLFLVDAMDGLNPDDQDLARQLRGFTRPIYVVVNKADHPNRDLNANEFYSLGLGEVFPVSGLHGRGVADLLDLIIEKLPDVGRADEAEPEEVKIAIIGRPNVGKSSLVNAFTGEQRMIVSNIAGTTRDAIDTTLRVQGARPFRLIDTAGIRRRGKIQGTVEYYMVNRAQKAIERADCALIVVDGSEGLTDGDKRCMKLAHDSGKAVVFAVNKWDTKEPPDGQPRKPSVLKQDFLKIISNEIPELAYATVGVHLGDGVGGPRAGPRRGPEGRRGVQLPRLHGPAQPRDPGRRLRPPLLLEGPPAKDLLRDAGLRPPPDVRAVLQRPGHHALLLPALPAEPAPRDLPPRRNPGAPGPEAQPQAPRRGQPDRPPNLQGDGSLNPAHARTEGLSPPQGKSCGATVKAPILTLTPTPGLPSRRADGHLLVLEARRP